MKDLNDYNLDYKLLMITERGYDPETKRMDMNVYRKGMTDIIIDIQDAYTNIREYMKMDKHIDLKSFKESYLLDQSLSTELRESIRTSTLGIPVNVLTMMSRLSMGHFNHESLHVVTDINDYGDGLRFRRVYNYLKALVMKRDDSRLVINPDTIFGLLDEYLLNDRIFTNNGFAFGKDISIAYISVFGTIQLLKYAYDMVQHLQLVIKEKITSDISFESLEYSLGFESLGDMYYSLEAEKLVDDKANEVKRKSQKVVSMYVKYGKVKNSVVSFMSKLNIIRTIFYKQKIGLIQSAFKRYGGQTPITENDVRGGKDIVELLMNDLPSYLKSSSDKLSKMYDSFLAMITKVASAQNDTDAIHIINGWTKKFDIQGDDPKQVGKIVTKDLFFQFAMIIMPFEPYGYTILSVTENFKLPPINHLISSFLLDNPNERPTERMLTDVIKNPNSFEVLFYGFKNMILKVANGITDGLLKDYVAKHSKFQDQMSKLKSTMRNVKNTKISALGDSAKFKDKQKIKKEVKETNRVYKSVLTASHTFTLFYSYMGSSINAVYSVSKRIDKSIQQSVRVLLSFDKTHKTSNSSNKHKFDLGHKDIQNIYKNKGMSKKATAKVAARNLLL